MDVGRFEILGASRDRYGDRIRLEVVTAARSAELRFGGAHPWVVPLEGSDGRFRVAARTPLAPVDLGAASLRVIGDDGRVVEHGLDRPAGWEAVEARRASDRALVMGFESCGDNCEFGLLQRTVGTERLGLLRYAGVDDVGVLSEAIERRFERFGEPGCLRASVGETGWMISHAPYRLSFHTGRDPRAVSQAEVLAFADVQLRFVADKFIDDLVEARKIFVFRTKVGGPDERAMRRLHDAMRGFGPVRLLWVREADEGHAHGSVVPVRDGLWRGFIRKLFPHELDYFSTTALWLQLTRCARDVISGSWDGRT